MPLLHEELTGKILASCFEVSNELGAGFLESVYQKALLVVIRQKGIAAIPEAPIDVRFRGETIGKFFADLLVENSVIVEVKAVTALTQDHKAQVINYLRATGIEVALLVNFGNPKLEYKRLQRVI